MFEDGMMRRRFLAALLGIFIICFGVSCAKKRLPWIQDGARVGSIYLVKDHAGRFYDYRDTRGRLIRRERHHRNGDLDSSFASENYRYDEAGHETYLRFTNPLGELTIGPPGFAVRRTERRPAELDWIIDHRHFDSSESPMLIPAGFHREEVLIGGDKRLKRRRFYDDHDEPVGVDLEHAAGIAEVRYRSLMGATPIVYETLIDLDGIPVLKRKLSGSTSSARFMRIRHHRHGYRY